MSGNSSTTDPGTEGDGDFMAGPNYSATSDVSAHGNPAGKSFSFTMSSSTSKYFTGLDTTLSNPKSFMRRIDVYIPAKYQDGTEAPLMVIQDGGGTAFGLIKLALDNLSADPDPARRLPAFIAIAVANGGGDGKGSERGLEYDTMSDRYARFIDDEVLSAIVNNTQIKAAYPKLAFTKDPEGRGAVGCSSGGAAAFTMAWFAPQLFRRVIAYSTTLVDQQDDDAPEERMYRFGAWEYHSEQELIKNYPSQKPVRMFINANDRDNGYNQPESGHHNWLMANQRTAAAFKTKGYHYRFVLGQNAGHCDAGVQRATIGEALRWVWRGYTAR
jgi:enterochelin esterase-like enzyme